MTCAVFVLPFAEEFQEGAEGVGDARVFGERHPHRPRGHGGRNFDLEDAPISRFGLHILTRDAADAHPLCDEFFHEPPAVDLDGGAEADAEARAEVIDGAPCHGVRLHEKERLVLQLP